MSVDHSSHARIKQVDQMRVLHVVSALDFAGVPNVIMAYLRNSPADAFEVDFIVHGDIIGGLEAEVTKRGSRVFHVVPRKKSLFANLRQIRTIIAKGDYDVIHSHLNFSSVFPLVLARLHGTPIRIAHAHGSFEPEGVLGRVWRAIAAHAVQRLATDYFSCSEVSGRWLFGGRWRSETSRSFLMRNAIDLEALKWNAERVPEDFWDSSSKSLRLIAVGRLSSEKNHLFLLDLADALTKLETPFELVILGGGPMRQELESAIQRRSLGRQVRLLGPRDDVGAWLGAADVCLMPSIREGLPLTLIEAQALGVPCIASPGVPSEVNLAGGVSFVPLRVESWIDAVAIAYGEVRGTGEEVAEQGYDIRRAAPDYVSHMRKLGGRTQRAL